MRKTGLGAAGGLSAAAYLAGLAAGPPWLRILAKPIPVLCLAAWCGTEDRYARLVTAGLLLSAGGDLLLEGEGLFVAGLAAFLLAHVCYLAAFWSDTRALRPWRAVPFAAYGGAAYLVLAPGLGALRGPVVLYMAAICAMMWRAAARVGTPAAGARSAWAGAVGAVLFAASDTLIALDRFHAAIPLVRTPIILLYWAGQLGIALSSRRAQTAAIR